MCVGGCGRATKTVSLLLFDVDTVEEVVVVGTVGNSALLVGSKVKVARCLNTSLLTEPVDA